MIGTKALQAAGGSIPYPNRGASDSASKPREAVGAGESCLELKIIIEPRPPVARVPWWVPGIKITIAGAILTWALFG
jgi:hypothetical protein